jgi:hypothetical protein
MLSGVVHDVTIPQKCQIGVRNVGSRRVLGGVAALSAAAGGGARTSHEVLDDQALCLFRRELGQRQAGFEQLTDIGH